MRYFLLLALSFSQIKGQSQNLQLNWVNQFAGSQEMEVADMAIDGNGNFLLTGYIIGTCDFDPSTNVYELTSAGGFDAFVCKLNPTGQLIWAHTIGSTSSDSGNGIDVDSDGNVVVVGSFRNTVDFDPSASTAELTSAGSGDAFVLKLDQDGNFLWVQRFGSFNSDDADAVVIDNNNNIIVAGGFQSTVDFDPGSGTQNLTATGSSVDAYFLRLTAAGDFSYAKRFGGSGSDAVRKLEVDADNYVYFAGHFSSTASFSPGSTLNITSAGSTDAVIGKLNSSGALFWAREFGGSQADSGFDIAIDATGNVYGVGYFRFLADFLPGSGVLQVVAEGESDAFAVKLNGSGSFQWMRKFGGIDFDYAECVELDPSENLVISGHFYGTSDFDPNENASALLTSVGGADIFITSITSNGDFLWADHVAGTGDQIAKTMVVDANNQIHVAGSFEETTDFNTGTGIDNLTSAGATDGFLTSLSALTVSVPAAEKPNVLVYPNPSSGSFDLRFGQRAEFKLTIVDMLGKIVVQKTGSAESITVTNEIGPGIYSLNLILDKKLRTSQTIIITP